jgi:alginate O-acetyltransferase complex protein AlgI
MPFHSPEFAILALATLLVYYFGKERYQHLVLLCSSLSFYYYAGITDTLLLLVVVAANYAGSLLIASQRRNRALLALLIVGNLSVLGYFKYRAMFLGWFAAVQGDPVNIAPFVIPLGISFYVFQMIAYQVDLSRGQVECERSFPRLLLYILFFPHHQAGPIMRPAKFLPQFHGEKTWDFSQIARGGRWILWGLCKKVAADQIGMLSDQGFADPAALSGAAGAWKTMLAYTAQIYGDFSGYSDIAIGLGYLFGYDLDRNFNQPYLSSDPSELWRRWHITLSAWLRDYLYIPLGGNRKGEARTELNLMLTMLLGGLWHGAAITFVLWGGIHGFLLVVQRRLPVLFRQRQLGWTITFIATVLAWVPFRAPSWAVTSAILRKGFLLEGGGNDWSIVLLIGGGLLGAHFFEDRILSSQDRRKRALTTWTRLPAIFRGLLLGAIVSSVILTLVDRTTYIYFRF